ncbi:hypothetical protein GCM10022419_079610 [Nonomuraea rosea]|uniref:Transposase n=1 Tax=Nonomuraea rosea TaxID=638574 RepID=A0ABP6YLC6_9ACTN
MMKLAVQVKLLPTPKQAAALQATLRAVNAAACQVSRQAHHLHASIRAGILGRVGSARRVRAESTPITFRADAAQPFDDRCLSWQIDARTVSIWSVAGAARNIAARGETGWAVSHAA